MSLFHHSVLTSPPTLPGPHLGIGSLRIHKAGCARVPNLSSNNAQMKPAAISCVTDQNSIPNAINVKKGGTWVMEMSQRKGKIVGR